MGYILERMLNKEKPAIVVTAESGRELECLVDTGATIPVYTAGSYGILKDYPSAIKLDNAVACMWGFGIGSEIADLYKIPELSIGSGASKLDFIDLIVACVSRSDFGFDMILSSTMFKHINYTICNYGGNSGNLILECEKDSYHIAPRWCIAKDGIEKLKHDGKDILASVYSFTQSEQDLSESHNPVTQMEAEMKQALADVDKKFEC